MIDYPRSYLRTWWSQLIELVLFVCSVNRSMARPYRWLCGVCTATHRDQKHGSLRAALTEGTSMWGFYKTKRSERRTRGPHWAENYVAFSTLRTEIFYTAETLYMCVCIYIYIYIKKKGISLCWSTCGGLELLSKVLGFLCALKPTREEWPSWPVDVAGLRSKAGR